MAVSRSSLFDDIHDPLVRDLVRASASGSGAILSPITSSPRAAAIASSHRVDRTPSTLRLVNTGYGSYRVTAPRATDVPANVPSRRVGRFSY